MNVILIAVISLGAIALVSAAILYIASKKFAVYEDPRIAQVAEVLPQANCGGCGYPGCSGFADACVKAGSLEGKLCPVGGQPVMAKVAEILGLDAAASEPMVAVVRCNGTCANRPRVNQYDGAKSCAIAASLYGGETGCSYGCLRLPVRCYPHESGNGPSRSGRSQMYGMWSLCQGLSQEYY